MASYTAPYRAPSGQARRPKGLRGGSNLPIEREDLEQLAPLNAHRPEMPLIESQHIVHGVSLRQYNYRSIREADLEVRIFLDYLFSTRNVGCIERLQLICAARNFVH